MTVTNLARSVTGGVDTHFDVHVAAALDERGTLLGVESFSTGLTRHLQAEHVRVVEVDRPNRQRRRLKGKSDPQDAISTARAALSGEATGEAKTRDGNVESMRVLRVARASARKGRTQALKQMRNLVSTASDPIRAEDSASFTILKAASAFFARELDPQPLR